MADEQVDTTSEASTSDVQQQNAPTAEVPSKIIESLRGFVQDNGGTGTAVLQSTGRTGVRITVIGENGVLGDRVVTSMDAAKHVVSGINGLEIGEWNRDLTSVATPEEPRHFERMAGQVVNSHRFPSPTDGLHYGSRNT